MLSYHTPSGRESSLGTRVCLIDERVWFLESAADLTNNASIRTAAAVVDFSFGRHFDRESIWIWMDRITPHQIYITHIEEHYDMTVGFSHEFASKGEKQKKCE